ncbi:MAG: hypothetical protein EHM52_05720, partial [Actinomycetota bacterium]
TLYKGVFHKIDAQKPARRRLARWLVARSLTSAQARRVLAGREPRVRPRGALRRSAAYAWALARAAALAPFHALADRLVFREVRAGLGGRLLFPLVGGGPLPDKVDEFFDAAGMPLLEGYGMTEAIVVMAMRDPFHRVVRTAGRVIRGMEHRLVGEDGAPCRPGEVGRLQVRGPNIMRGYYRDPERTEEVLDPDGWLDTHDLALVHADGNCASSVASTTPSCSRTARTSTRPTSRTSSAPASGSTGRWWWERGARTSPPSSSRAGRTSRPWPAAWAWRPTTRRRSSPTSASSGTTAPWRTTSAATRGASRRTSACTACACGPGSSASATSSRRPSSCAGRSSCASIPVRSTSSTRPERVSHAPGRASHARACGCDAGAVGRSATRALSGCARAPPPR